MGGGNDRLSLLNGSVITGTVDGGTGSDSVSLGGTGGNFAGAVNFERLDVTAGTWAITGTSGFANGAGIGAGRLNVNGTLNAAVTVGNGGTLGGTGTVGGGVTVQSGGTVAPGTSIGTLAVAGNFVQASGSTYAAETTASGAVGPDRDHRHRHDPERRRAGADPRRRQLCHRHQLHAAHCDRRHHRQLFHRHPDRDQRHRAAPARLGQQA